MKLTSPILPSAETPRISKSRIPRDVLEALNILEKNGYEAYIVGGAVRDLLLGKKPSDYDISTNARPETVMEIFQKAGWKTIPTGIEYGTVTVVSPRRRNIEITTFRREMYVEGRGRKPVVEFSDSIMDDVLRRDFTINALYLDGNGVVHDLVGGLEDLRRRIIRFVGAPHERINEDPLRLIRAIRFAVMLGFDIDFETYTAIRIHAYRITEVSRERWRMEIEKVLPSPEFHRFIELMADSGLLSYVMPEVDEARTITVWNRRLFDVVLDEVKILDRLTDDPEVKLAGLLHELGKARYPGTVYPGYEKKSVEIANNLLYRLRFDKKTIRHVATLIRLHEYPLTIHWYRPEDITAVLIAKIGELTPKLLLLTYAHTRNKKYLKAYRFAKKQIKKGVPKPLVDGKTLLKLLGEPPGPWVGFYKEKLYALQLRENLKTPDEVIKRAVELGVLPERILKKIDRL